MAVDAETSIASAKCAIGIGGGKSLDFAGGGEIMRSADLLLRQVDGKLELLGNIALLLPDESAFPWGKCYGRL